MSKYLLTHLLPKMQYKCTKKSPESPEAAMIDWSSYFDEDFNINNGFLG